MNLWKRTLIYLRRNSKRCILLLIVLTTIASSLMVCFAVWVSTGDGIDKLRRTYGNAFSVEINFSDGSVEDTSLWERKINEFGAEEYRYLGPSLDDTFIEKVMSIDGIKEVCREQSLYLYFKDVEFIPGMHANAIEKEEKDPEAYAGSRYNPTLAAKNNELKGYSKSDLSNYFRTKSFELIKGKKLEDQDQNQVIISDELAERNQLSLGDVIHAELTERVLEGGDPNHVYAEADLEIAGIYHVNVNQVISEYTAEPDIAGNFMFSSFNTVQQLIRDYYKVIEKNKEPLCQKVTFFIDDPRNIDGILNEIQEIKSIDWHAFEVKTDDTAYQSALSPLQNMNKISIFMIIFIVAVCIILLTLILRMWVGTRKKEMGILLSMGNSPAGIMGQFVLEGIMLLSVALILACAISAGVSNRIGNIMLSGMNAHEERMAENSEEVVGEPPAAAEDVAAFNEQFVVKTKVEVPEEIECRITAGVIGVTGGILAAVLIIATVMTARKTLKIRPKEILSNL